MKLAAVCRVSIIHSLSLLGKWRLTYAAKVGDRDDEREAQSAFRAAGQVVREPRRSTRVDRVHPDIQDHDGEVASADVGFDAWCEWEYDGVADDDERLGDHDKDGAAAELVRHAAEAVG